MTDLAAKHQWNWSVELVQNPDDNLKHTTATIVTADSIILNSCSAWVNMAAEIIESSIPQARVINLRTQSLRTAPSNA